MTSGLLPFRVPKLCRMLTLRDVALDLLPRGEEE